MVVLNALLCLSVGARVCFFLFIGAICFRLCFPCESCVDTALALAHISLRVGLELFDLALARNDKNVRIICDLLMVCQVDGKIVVCLMW